MSSLNFALSEKILKELIARGVREFCLCAGARNSPLIIALEKIQGVKLYSFFEERSAAFFALGRIMAHEKPMAVVTTSGTAVAELLPAVIEAYYSSYPLILLTADRPRRFRGSGAPQSIEQVNIFSNYVESCKDIESVQEEFDLSLWTQKQALHVNVCFDEPLIQGEPVAFSVSEIPEKQNRLPVFENPNRAKLLNPAIVVGRLDKKDIDKVAIFLEHHQIPFYAEAISQLRGRPQLKHLLLQQGEATLSEALNSGSLQSVLRIGGVPTLRLWRDLELKLNSVPVVSCAGNEFTGLSRRVMHYVGYSNLTQIQCEFPADLKEKILARDQVHAGSLQKALLQNPKAETSLFFQLAQKLRGQSVYLGNSLPIREWDLVQPMDLPLERVAANRGANGIDGQISTFFGWAKAGTQNWALIGDLTALYDLSAPWIGSQMESLPLRVVVVNNFGGQIFRRMFQKDIFLNQHEINFQSWAKMWNWPYFHWTEVPDSIENLPQRAIIELCPDSEQSNHFWQTYQLNTRTELSS